MSLMGRLYHKSLDARHRSSGPATVFMVTGRRVGHTEGAVLLVGYAVAIALPGLTAAASPFPAALAARAAGRSEPCRHGSSASAGSGHR